ncbi:MAG: 4Fe-4S dicluster domain-containing protein [Bacteroidales bacterium]|nr:4Fe-4S dicluster domain-containing protein [Bacteroidales bacterium]
MNSISIPKQEWDEKLIQSLSSHEIYAPLENDFSCDYVKLEADTVTEIVYNKPKPVTPLKKFFLPVKENVTSIAAPGNPVAIIGTPNCDVMALAFLDEIYLDQEYTDPAYRQRRENTTIISTDCLSIREHCHCTSYGIDPTGNDHSDISLAVIEDQVILTVHGPKGEAFIQSLGIIVTVEPEKGLMQSLGEMHSSVLEQLKEQNKGLPGYEETGKLISANGMESWKKYASTCVSCGACSAICPTCSCFLLIDKPGFEKVRQLDTCQYPGFERVAGGEDALNELPERFRNRYMCKYVWKPEKYQLKACTGCGRCIETCIGQINKNELILELSK